MWTWISRKTVNINKNNQHVPFGGGDIMLLRLPSPKKGWTLIEDLTLLPFCTLKIHGTKRQESLRDSVIASAPHSITGGVIVLLQSWNKIGYNSLILEKATVPRELLVSICLSHFHPFSPVGFINLIGLRSAGKTRTIGIDKACKTVRMMPFQKKEEESTPNTPTFKRFCRLLKRLFSFIQMDCDWLCSWPTQLPKKRRWILNASCIFSCLTGQALWKSW